MAHHLVAYNICLDDIVGIELHESIVELYKIIGYITHGFIFNGDRDRKDMVSMLIQLVKCYWRLFIDGLDGEEPADRCLVKKVYSHEIVDTYAVLMDVLLPAINDYIPFDEDTCDGRST